jgi:hypothetical protein
MLVRLGPFASNTVFRRPEKLGFDSVLFRGRGGQGGCDIRARKSGGRNTSIIELMPQDRRGRLASPNFSCDRDGLLQRVLREGTEPVPPIRE